MIQKLEEALKLIPKLAEDPSIWSSLVINRRKPFTYRAFTQLGDIRVCLHRFEGCDPEEAFYHPHPWAGAFTILEGSYRMKVGYSADRFSEPKSVTTVIMVAGSKYEIVNPLTWHTVEPLTDVVYTVMVNSEPWGGDFAHTQVRTTKGKDLESMSVEQLREHLGKFQELLTK